MNILRYFIGLCILVTTTNSFANTERVISKSGNLSADVRGIGNTHIILDPKLLDDTHGELDIAYVISTAARTDLHIHSGKLNGVICEDFGFREINERNRMSLSHYNSNLRRLGFNTGSKEVPHWRDFQFPVDFNLLTAPPVDDSFLAQQIKIISAVFCNE